MEVQERNETRRKHSRERVKWITIILEGKRVTLGCHDKRAKIYFSFFFFARAHEKKRFLYFWTRFPRLSFYFSLPSSWPTRAPLSQGPCASASKKIIRGTSAKNNFPRGCDATARASIVPPDLISGQRNDVKMSVSFFFTLLLSPPPFFFLFLPFCPLAKMDKKFFPTIVKDTIFEKIFSSIEWIVWKIFRYKGRL